MAYDLTNSMRKKLRRYLIATKSCRNIKCLSDIANMSNEDIANMINSWKDGRISILNSKKTFLEDKIDEVNIELADIEE